MEIIDVEIATLTLDPNNARQHSDKNIEAIKGSLQKFGQQKPIVISADGVVVAGNGTVVAAKALGWKSIRAVRTDLRGSDAVAYALADNRTAELAEWNTEELFAALDALKTDGFDLDAIGFDDADLKELIVEPEFEPQADEDDVPEQVETRVKPGDLWLLDPYWECDGCKKRYGYDEGKAMKACPCG